MRMGTAAITFPELIFLSFCKLMAAFSVRKLLLISWYGRKNNYFRKRTKSTSALVGYLQTITMYPLDFEEFLQVFHVSEDILDVLRQSYQLVKPVDEAIHKKIMDIFQLYLIIGGMPAAVASF